MRPVLSGFLVVAAIAILVLLGRGLTASDGALAGHGPSVLKEVLYVALDTDTSGNTANGGVHVPATTTVQTTLSKPVDPTPFDIDAVVDEVRSADKLQAIGVELSFNNNILNCAFPDTFQMLDVNSNSIVKDFSSCDNAGQFVGASAVDDCTPTGVSPCIGNEPGESGVGILTRFKIICVGPGVDALNLDVANVVSADATDLVTSNTTVTGATITCGEEYDPTVLTATTVADTTGLVSPGTFNVVVDGTVNNLGPTADANTDIEVTLNMPGDCTADGTGANGETKTEANLNIPGSGSVAIATQTYIVECTAHSEHSFTATIEVTLDELTGFDGDDTNNDEVSGADVTAVSDVTTAVITAEATTDTLANTDDGISGLCTVSGSSVATTNSTCTDVDAELVKNDA
ncbi:MAG: hypothetical protein IIA44_11125, partial [Acidobacteria bacterium]|nr:hypothetical protein [Acidobacteriota bacterium]